MFNWNADAIVADYPWPPLSHEAPFRQLLGFLAADPHVTDVRHAAYMLATTRHETAFTYQPIEEYGKGAGREYGKMVNPDTGAPDPNGLAYYGRGFVQLTWLSNYRHFGQILGIELAHHPELALDPKIAYAIMSHGMRNGSFTGVGLPRFIHDTFCDYVGARRIINGLDKSELIAGYAEEFQKILA